jgi:hypothetical protein
MCCQGTFSLTSFIWIFLAPPLLQGHFYDHLLTSLDRSGVAYNGIALPSSNSPVPLLTVREFTANLAEGQPGIGINFKEALAGQETELEVESVDAGGQASGAGLHPGAVVIAVGGTAVHTFAEFKAELNLCLQRFASADMSVSDTASEGSGSAAVEAATSTPGYRPCIVRFEDRSDTEKNGGSGAMSKDDEVAQKAELSARRVLAHAFANNHHLHEVEYVVLKASASPIYTRLIYLPFCSFPVSVFFYSARILLLFSFFPFIMARSTLLSDCHSSRKAWAELGRKNGCCGWRPNTCTTW